MDKFKLNNQNKYQYRSYDRLNYRNKYYSLEIPSKPLQNKPNYPNLPQSISDQFAFQLKSKPLANKKRYDYLKSIDEDKKIIQNLVGEGNFSYLKKRQKFASVENLKNYKENINQQIYKVDKQLRSNRNKNYFNANAQIKYNRQDFNSNIYQQNQLNYRHFNKKYNYPNSNVENPIPNKLDKMYKILSEQIIQKKYVPKYDCKYKKDNIQINRYPSNYLKLTDVIMTESIIEGPNYKR